MHSLMEYHLQKEVRDHFVCRKRKEHELKNLITVKNSGKVSSYIAILFD